MARTVSPVNPRVLLALQVTSAPVGMEVLQSRCVSRGLTQLGDKSYARSVLQDTLAHPLRVIYLLFVPQDPTLSAPKRNVQYAQLDTRVRVPLKAL